MLKPFVQHHKAVSCALEMAQFLRSVCWRDSDLSIRADELASKLMNFADIVEDYLDVYDDSDDED